MSSCSISEYKAVADHVKAISWPSPRNVAVLPVQNVLRYHDVFVSSNFYLCSELIQFGKLMLSPVLLFVSNMILRAPKALRNKDRVVITLCSFLGRGCAAENVILFRRLQS